MAPHSNILAWKIPWTEEPGGLQSMGSQRVRHDWATSLSHIGEGNGNPFQCSCLENPRDGGAWWAAVNGVAQSWTRLKRLSSSRDIYTWPWMMNVISPGGNGIGEGTLNMKTTELWEYYVPENSTLWVCLETVSGGWGKMWSEWLPELKILRILLCHVNGKILNSFLSSLLKKCLAET